MFAYTNPMIIRDISAKRVKILRYTVSSATILDLKKSTYAWNLWKKHNLDAPENQ